MQNELNARRMRRTRVMAAAVTVAGLTAACGGHTPSSNPTPPPDPIQVQVQTVATAERPGAIESGGLVQATTTAILTSRLMAPIREVRVAAGQRVRAGQVLVVLDDRDLGAQARSAEAAAGAAAEAVTAGASERQAAEAALTLARSTHQRIAALAARKSATAQELDEATASLEAAHARVAASEARVAQAQASLSSARAGRDVATVTAGFARITAPFDGVVTETLVEPGNMAVPGGPLLRLEQQGGFRLELRLDATRVADVVVGQEVPVSVDGASPIDLEGRVVEVSRAVHSDARAVLVKVALPADDRLRSGMFGRARLTGPLVPMRVVPASSVVRRGQVVSVFVADGNVARVRLVALGRQSRDGVEVTSGLTDGERVVVAPPVSLMDGSPIRTGAR